MAAVAPIERRVIDGKGMYAAKLARQPLRGRLMQLKEEGHRQLSIGAAVCAAASRPLPPAIREPAEKTRRHG